MDLLAIGIALFLGFLAFADEELTKLALFGMWALLALSIVWAVLAPLTKWLIKAAPTWI